jgi:polysaccharide biosynthesis protein PslG
MTRFHRPRRSRRFALLLVVCLLSALGGAAAAAGQATQASKPPNRVPLGFFGTVIGDPLFPGLVSNASSTQFANQMDLMEASGVESVRAVFDWSAAQPYSSWSKVPADQQGQFSSDGVDNVPTNFDALDTLVADASARGLTVLPVVISAPAWDGQTYKGAALAIPRRDAPYASFLAALVKRYGPHGTFWRAESPKLAITSWQVWNEPDVTAFWGQHPFAQRYIALLRAARVAIKHEDPHARIVLAGLANYSWKDLRSIYAVHGARSLFDVVGVHPYTKTPQGVITILDYARQVMRAAGDGAKPMIADEISWPSSKGKTVHNTGYDFATTEAGQARDVAQVLPLLAANRLRLNLAGVYYYTWAGVETPNGLAFNYSGLLKYVHKSFVRKPVFYAYRQNALALERCHEKAAIASQCAKPY